MKAKKLMFVALALLVGGLSTAPAWAQDSPLLLCPQSEVVEDSPKNHPEVGGFFSGKDASIVWVYRGEEGEADGDYVAIGAVNRGVTSGPAGFFSDITEEVHVVAEDPFASKLVLVPSNGFEVGKYPSAKNFADFLEDFSVLQESITDTIEVVSETDIGRLRTRMIGCVPADGVDGRAAWCKVYEGLKGPDAVDRITRGVAYLNGQVAGWIGAGSGSVTSCDGNLWLYVRDFGPWLEQAAVSGTATAVEQVGDNVPEGFALAQNYPNPFNSTTTISYTLSQPAPVRLAVYNVLGREVVVLVDGVKPAGTHEVVLDASSLGSGLYPYRLMAGDRVLTGKMVMVR